MKITFVTKSVDRSGGYRVLHTLAYNLQRLGHDVLIAHLPEFIPSRLERLKRRILPSRVDKGTFLEMLQVPRIKLESSRPIVDADLPDADVVVATWWETAEWVSKLSPSKGAKTYLIQGHEATIPGQPSAKVTATLKFPLHKIVVAQWLADVARNGDPNEPISLVPNSVDTSEFHAHPRIKQAPSTFGFMYSAMAIKGSDIAVAALELAKKAEPSIQAHCFGGISPISRSSIPIWCKFHENPTPGRIRELYSTVDAWLFASRIEGFGLPILEAMACRTPVIATTAGAAPQLINAENGRLVALEDAQAMASAMLEIHRMDETAWQQLSNGALKTAQSYTWSDAARKLEEAFLVAKRRTEAGQL